MAPINQNRMAECCAKKKSDPGAWEEHLRKDRERNKARRNVKKEERLSDPNLLKADREKERLRKRAVRERKNSLNWGHQLLKIRVVERRDENFLSVNFMHKTGTPSSFGQQKLTFRLYNQMTFYAKLMCLHTLSPIDILECWKILLIRSKNSKNLNSLSSR
ncbi:hypothetical protein J6590_069522 [Homalodisca vitripennis]|nr:hypothetical protein J6590_069522 [Homalodisca vitripennis]